MDSQDFSAFDQRIRCESSKLERVAIRRKGNKLYVRGNFPAKPGQTGTTRADIPTGCNATVAGLKVAFAKAQAIDSDLQWGRFDWGPYLRGHSSPPATIGEWLERYEADHWQHTERTPSKEASFQSCYRHYFGLLPSSAPLSIAVLRESIVTRSKPATRSRELCYAASAIGAKCVRSQI